MKQKKTLSEKIDEYQEEWASRLALGDIPQSIYDEGIKFVVMEHFGEEDVVSIPKVRESMNKFLNDLEEGL